MKIINLVKSEFIKNYNIKRFAIIIPILMIASIFLVNFTNTELDEYQNRLNNSNNPLQGSIDSFKRAIEKFDENSNPSTLDKYNNYLNKKYVEYAELIKNNVKNSYYDFKFVLLNEELLPLVMQNYIVELMNNDMEDEFITSNCDYKKEIVDEYFDEHRNKDVYGKEKEYVSMLCKYSDTQRNEIYEINKNIIKNLENLLKEDKYYLYLQYQVDNNQLSNNEMVSLLIDKKVEDSFDELVFNYRQYQILENNANMKIYSEEEYEEELKGVPHDPYKLYYNYQNMIKENAIKYRSILLYASSHGIKTSIHYNYDTDKIDESIRYQNTKLKVDYVLHLSIVIILLTSILNGGIVSNEHSKGTIKNIITAPVRRWKILLSKFIYLILDMYIMWFIGLIIISIIAGLKYGFSDLFEPLLVYRGGKVIEINYYLHLIKEIFISSIPVMCFLSILFFISTISLSTSLSVGISTCISVISLFIWLINLFQIFKYIIYTPFIYFDLGFIKTNSNWYINSLHYVPYYNALTGIIISIIVMLVLYIITTIIYTKRDIKN